MTVDGVKLLKELEGYLDRFLEGAQKWPKAAAIRSADVAAWTAFKSDTVPQFKAQAAGSGDLSSENLNAVDNAISSVNSSWNKLEAAAEKTGETSTTPWLLFGVLAAGAVGVWWLMNRGPAGASMMGLRRRRRSR